MHEKIEIEQVTIGRPIDAIPPIREEGDTTVIPVVEEIVVVERRLVPKEELLLRRVRTTQRHRETVTLREKQAVIERTDLAETKSGAPA
jgi:stress response protein YsnF